MGNWLRELLDRVSGGSWVELVITLLARAVWLVFYQLLKAILHRKR